MAKEGVRLYVCDRKCVTKAERKCVYQSSINKISEWIMLISCIYVVRF